MQHYVVYARDVSGAKSSYLLHMEGSLLDARAYAVQNIPDAVVVLVALRPAAA